MRLSASGATWCLWRAVRGSRFVVIRVCFCRCDDVLWCIDLLRYRRFIHCERWPGVLTAARVAQSLCCKTAAFGRLATTQADALATTAGRSHTPTRTLRHPNHRHHQPQEHLIPNSPPVTFNPIPPLPRFNRLPYLVVLKAFVPCTSHRFHAGAFAVMRPSFQANSFRSDAHALACSRDGRWLRARATNRNSLRV